MSKRIRESYAQSQKRKKQAKLAKRKLITDAIAMLDKLSKIAIKENSEFNSDETREIDQARFNLQSILGGWTPRSRR